MIDVHVLVRPDNPHWEACYNSLKDQPINLHILDAEPGHIGRGRIRGYSQGTSEWVAYVDDDDLVTPDAFAYVNSIMMEYPNCDAYYFAEQCIGEDDRPCFHVASRDKRPWGEIESAQTIEVPFRPLWGTHAHFHILNRKRLLHHIDKFQAWPRGGDTHIKYDYFNRPGKLAVNMRPIYLWRICDRRPQYVKL